MNKQLNNLEVIAEMANLKLKAEVFRVVDYSVKNGMLSPNFRRIQLTEDIEKKMFIIECNDVKLYRYSNQEAVDLIIEIYNYTDVEN
jgi:hypothetical protein